MRRLLPLLVALSAGCLDADKPRDGLNNVLVDTAKYPAASSEVAARVDQVGRQLVGSSPFLGFEPTFHTLGQPEPEICHPDRGGVFVSAGLVERCRSDAELAAVLATELAVIKAEQRLTDRRRHEPLAPLPDGAAGTDPTQLGTQAVFDKNLGTKPPPADKPEDRRTTALELLKAAGYDPAVLDAVEPLLTEAARNHKASATFGGKSGRPRWSN